MSDDIYRHKIIDHYRNPRHFGELAHPTHTAGLQNISCGDAVQLYAILDKGIIKELSFTGTGCAVSIAATSLLCEKSLGEKISVVKKYTKKDIEKLLGIPISGGRENCATLGLKTLQKLQKNQKQHGKKR